MIQIYLEHLRELQSIHVKLLALWLAARKGSGINKGWVTSTDAIPQTAFPSLVKAWL